MRFKVVLDTNVLIDAIPEWSRHRIILDALVDDRPAYLAERALHYFF